VEVLIVDCLREIDHPAHLSLSESLAFIEQINPARAVLTNMHSDLDYQTLLERLPEHIVPGFDGFQLELPCCPSERHPEHLARPILESLTSCTPY
jgi:phosphoribosyl 1,2-cyclic phosphate phosphodiesterase